MSPIEYRFLDEKEVKKIFANPKKKEKETYGTYAPQPAYGFYGYIPVVSYHLPAQQYANFFANPPPPKKEKEDDGPKVWCMETDNTWTLKTLATISKHPNGVWRTGPSGAPYFVRK